MMKGRAISPFREIIFKRIPKDKSTRTNKSPNPKIKKGRYAFTQRPGTRLLSLEKEGGSFFMNKRDNCLMYSLTYSFIM